MPQQQQQQYFQNMYLPPFIQSSAYYNSLNASYLLSQHLENQSPGYRLAPTRPEIPFIYHPQTFYTSMPPIKNYFNCLDATTHQEKSQFSSNNSAFEQYSQNSRKKQSPSSLNSSFDSPRHTPSRTPITTVTPSTSYQEANNTNFTNKYLQNWSMQSHPKLSSTLLTSKQ